MYYISYIPPLSFYILIILYFPFGLLPFKESFG